MMKNTRFKWAIIASTSLPTAPLWADSLVFGFQNPAFSGVGYSAHVLTIENQEQNRKDALRDEEEAARLAEERDLENSVEARFLRNLESRIYSQISRQLVDNLFGENGGVFLFNRRSVSARQTGIISLARNIPG